MSRTMHDGQGLELSIESTSASGTHILDLNFDCLYDIFSLECFSILDLCAIGETHDRFKGVADCVFFKRHKNYLVNLRKTTDIETNTRIVSNFGPFMSVSIYSDEYRQDNEKLTTLLDWVTKYCRNTLDYLQLLCSTITEAQTIKLKPIFGQLQKISLCYCKIHSGKMLFSNCKSLVELKLVDIKFDDRDLVLENTFPKLDRFEYIDYRYKATFSRHGHAKIRTYSHSTDLWWNSNKSNDFFSRHKNLKSLNLKGLHWCGITDLLPRIADNFKQLAELDILIDRHEDIVKFEEALSSILTFEHLNKLKMKCKNRNITKFIQKLKNLKSLEILSLWKVSGDSEFIPAVSKLARLKKLELGYCTGLTNLVLLADLERLEKLKFHSMVDLDFNIVQMINRLINLKTLFLHVTPFEMDEEMYLRIVHVVRERPGRFQDTLQIKCFTAKSGIANSFGDGYCRSIVKIIELK